MIRIATEADEPVVRELFSECGEEARHDVVLLADEVGVAALDRKSERRWLLDLLYVRPSARSEELENDLIRAAAEHVRAQSGETLAVAVPESKGAARGRYERLGFRTVERVLAAPVAELVSDRKGGPTFGTIHVQTDDVEKVRRDAAKVLRADPEVELAEGWVRVRSDATDADPSRLKALARELSYTRGGVVLAIGIEEGAVVRYNLYDRGSGVDEYLSVPEYYGELPPGDVIALGANPTVVARLTGADHARVRAVARTASSPADLPPAEELYAQIAETMGVTV